MLEFIFSDKIGEIERFVHTKTTDHETITEAVDEFVRFLQAVSYHPLTIKNGFLQAIEEIDDSIKESYMMSSESECEEGEE